MLISHKYKFIFVHNRKAAGSSITACLNRFMGPDDLQIGVWRDAMAYGGKYNKRVWREVFNVYGLQAFGYYVSNLRIPKVSRFVERVQEHKYSSILCTTNIAHPTAFAVRQAFPCEWNNYHKFCVVRDPYDKVVSDYKWRTRKLPLAQVSFIEFLRRLADPERPDPEGVVPNPPTNWPLFTIDDELAVDTICHFENLHDDLRSTFYKLGLGCESVELPTAKKSSSRRETLVTWGQEEERLIRDIFQKEFDYLDNISSLG